ALRGRFSTANPAAPGSPRPPAAAPPLRPRRSGTSWAGGPPVSCRSQRFLPSPCWSPPAYSIYRDRYFVNPKRKPRAGRGHDFPFGSALLGVAGQELLGALL